MTTKPTVFIVGAVKGGVGKTTTTRALLSYFDDHGIAAKAFDTETETIDDSGEPGVLVHFHPDITEVVDLTKSAGQMRVFDNLSSAYVTVIDCRAGLLVQSLEVLRDIGFLEAVRAGQLDVVVLHVMGATATSFDEIPRVGAILEGAKHFLVMNHINDTEYWGWDSPSAQEVINKTSGVINIPKCDEMAMEACGAKKESLKAFDANPDNSFVLKGKLRAWKSKCFGQFHGRAV